MSSRPTFRDAAWIAVLVPALAGTLALSPAQAAAGDAELWGTNGYVLAAARSGDTLYLGGWFGAVGPNTGGGVPLARRSGAAMRPFPRVCGSVSAAIPDGAGGWYIGGSFDAVEGAPRSSLAHVLANGSLSPWHPILTDATIYALARRGRRLYVGGYFTSVNGAHHQNLVGFDIRSGALIDWDPAPDGAVRCLLPHLGSLYVGGEFSQIGGQPRVNIAQLDEASGLATCWRGDTDGAVFSAAIWRRSVFVGGEFDHAGGRPRNSLAALDATTGVATPWDAQIGPRRLYIAHGDWVWPYVGAVAVDGGVVYAGGWFNSVGGVPRVSIAAFDAITARPTRFDARLHGEDDVVTAIAVRDRTIYIGGGFGEVAGEARPNLAALDATTGSVTRWNPRPAGQVGARLGGPSNVRIRGVIDAVVGQGNTVYVGGRFASMGDWVERNGAVALDLTTGAATPWDPRLQGNFVTGLGLIGNRVYLTGSFLSVNGTPKFCLAAVDATSGSLLEWGPQQPTATQLTAGTLPEPAAYNYYSFEPHLAVKGNTVYVGGAIIHYLLGETRFHFAAFDGASGELSSWNALADGDALAILPQGDRVYLGGLFSNVGGVRRGLVGAVDATVGRAVAWDPQPSGAFAGAVVTEVNSIAASANTVYLGGTFASMDAAERRGLAAVDAVAGAVLPWDPEPDAAVDALVVSAQTVWAGGDFGRISGESQPFLAAVDAASGLLTDARPRLNGPVRMLLASGDDVFAGGEFSSVDGFPRGGIALIRGPGAVASPAASGASTDSPRQDTWISSAIPNPARASASVRFGLAHASEASLAVFDLQGRCVATVLDKSALPAGEHVAQIRTAGLAPGCYLYLLEAGGLKLTRKLVVIR